MSNDGGTVQQPSRTTVPLGKSVRRALRAAIGVPKKPPRKDRAKLKPKKKKKPNPGRSTSLSKEAAAARKESVVRVVLSSGVVEVYPCVVPARAVVSRHPPGLCLARPDVFRNPHGAVLRPDEPLFPGHKFLLVPWSTVDKLKHRIPESSVGAFLLHDDDDDDEDGHHLCYGSAAAAADEDGDDDDDDGDDMAGSEEVLSTETEASEEEEEQERRRHSSGGGGGAPAAVVEWDDGEAAAGDGSGGGGSFTPACSARGYFEARDRWYECRFRRLVEQGIAVEPSAEDDDEGGGGGGGGQQPEQSRRKDGQQQQARSKGSSKKKKKKKRRERPPAAAAAAPTPGFRAFATATLRRTWEPSLPSVEEEENAAVSPLSSGLHSPAASVGAGGGGQPAQN